MKLARISFDFLKKYPKTLQRLEISRFQFDFHHDYTGDLFDFRLNFRFYFQFNFHRAAPRPVANSRAAVLIHGHIDDSAVCHHVPPRSFQDSETVLLHRYGDAGAFLSQIASYKTFRWAVFLDISEARFRMYQHRL